jgi:hypothetical protein
MLITLAIAVLSHYNNNSRLQQHKARAMAQKRDFEGKISTTENW